MAEQRTSSQANFDLKAVAAARTELPLHPIEGAAAAVVPVKPRASLATLIAAHVLRDSEIVLLIVKPSLWYVLLVSLRFIAAVLIAAIAARVYYDSSPASLRLYLELSTFLIFGRLTWAMLNWMGRIYVLTDRRILRLSGVFSVDVFECPLRHIARTRLVCTCREQVVYTGSIEIIPQDEIRPVDYWQTIARPKEIHEEILAAISRAKQHPLCGE